MLVGGFLVLVALKSYFPIMEKALQRMMKYERIYLAVMGIIHGLTNLGGSLLTAVVHAKSYEKDTTRVTVAICYATFAVFQLITLFLLGSSFELTFAGHMSFVLLGVIVFLLTEEIVYSAIDNQKYSQVFAVFLLCSGVLLMIK
jgi:Sulfite exporter TauE/SafE.